MSGISLVVLSPQRYFLPKKGHFGLPPRQLTHDPWATLRGKSLCQTLGHLPEPHIVSDTRLWRAQHNNQQHSSFAGESNDPLSAGRRYTEANVSKKQQSENKYSYFNAYFWPMLYLLKEWSLRKTFFKPLLIISSCSEAVLVSSCNLLRWENWKVTGSSYGFIVKSNRKKRQPVGRESLFSHKTTVALCKEEEKSGKADQ